MAIEDRYEIVPELRVYDNVPSVLTPYLTIMSKPNFRSDVINTDRNGFRVSYGYDGLIDSHSWWHKPRRGIVLGGSFVWGVGATNDRHTLVSALNSLAGYSFVNLGIRAGNSTQELISSIPFLASSECVVVCSGINNLVVSLQSLGINELFGPLFGEEIINDLASLSVFSLPNILRLHNVGARALLGALISRMRNRLLRPSVMLQDKEKTKSPLPLDGYGVDNATREALKRQSRDLSIIATSLYPGTRLIFAAQPFAGVSLKQLWREERRLFEITDALQAAHWQIVKTYLLKLWPSYVVELKSMCKEKGIRFIDLNAVDFEGWTFVDRVHMTDHGYRQVAIKIAAEVG